MQENSVFSVLNAVDCSEHVEKMGLLFLEMVEAGGEGGGGAAPGEAGGAVGAVGDAADDEVRDAEQHLGLGGAGEEELVVFAAADGELDRVPALAGANMLERQGEGKRRHVDLRIHA